MATFDFSGDVTNKTAGGPATFIVTYSTIQNGINFTFTVTALTAPVTNGTLTLSDEIDTGVGLNLALTSFDAVSFLVSLSFSTTPSRTAFTNSAQLSVSPSWASAGTLQSVSGNKILTIFTNPNFIYGNVGISSLTANFLCFAEDTKITTETGEVAVQDLRAGDLVRTADGRLVPVRWIGERFIDTGLAHPAKAYPVRIQAGALGNNIPTRDLRVSPDHGIEIDGHLINAVALINGTTITQERVMPKDGFTYYHVELDAHDLILAEGAATESYIDYGVRTAFDNDDGHQVHIVEMPLPRISATRMLPDSVRNRIKPAATSQAA